MSFIENDNVNHYGNIGNNQQQKQNNHNNQQRPYSTQGPINTNGTTLETFRRNSEHRNSGKLFFKN